MKISKKSLILVSIQFIVGVILIVTSPLNKLNLPSIVLILSGAYISLWGIYTMKRGVIRITPEVSKYAIFITDGPYKLIRHPMYSGIIIGGFGLLLSHFTILRILIYFLLIVDLLIKLNYEEKLLEKHFHEYKNYKKKTYHLFPYIY